MGEIQVISLEREMSAKVFRRATVKHGFYTTVLVTCSSVWCQHYDTVVLCQSQAEINALSCSTASLVRDGFSRWPGGQSSLAGSWG